MSKKERTIASDEQETQLDSRNELFAAFEKLILPPIDDSVSPEDAMNALTKADRDAMAKMGDSSELVSNIIENARLQKHQSEQAETPTIAMKRGETETTPMERLGNGENEDDFAKLLSDQAKFESVHEVTWNTRFSIMRELGRGGQGVVYLIKYADEMSGQQALKIFSANPFEDVKDYRKEMRRMASVASVVNSIHHDNLLDVEHFFDHSGSYVMMMRLIDGYDLRYLLRSETVERLQDQVDAERWSYFSNVIYGIGENGRWYLKPGVAVNIIGNCLRGLSALHANNIVHADIKPSNIMLGLYGGIKLIDIGSAFSLDVKPKRQTWTPMYAPPEFFQRREWTRQSDLASLGYVLIELLTGQPAVTVPGVGFESTRSGIARDEDALLQAKLDLPDRLDEILSNDVRQSGQLMTLLRRLIDPDPRQRFDNAVEAIEQGTYLFHKQLVQGDLEVDRPTEIQRWIEDAKRVKC